MSTVGFTHLHNEDDLFVIDQNSSYLYNANLTSLRKMETFCLLVKFACEFSLLQLLIRNEFSNS